MASLLITDGACCYLCLAKEYKVKHKFACALPQIGITKQRLQDSEIQVNTGLVDQMWADVERWARKPITARNKEGQVNGLLWCYVYQWWLRTSCKGVN